MAAADEGSGPERHEAHTTADDAWNPPVDDSTWIPPDVDVNQPSIARVYDYALGGKTNFTADRAVYQRIYNIYPQYAAWARANRGFLSRSVQAMADSGIRQFLDLGTGLPTEPNVHQIARQIQPDASVAYVDNDPIVLAHSRAMLARDSGVVSARHDVTSPDEVLADPAIREAIDFTRPVGLLLVAVLHFVRVDMAPALLARYCSALAPGSMVGISALTLNPLGARAEDLAEGDAIGQMLSSRLVIRTIAEFEGLFDGMELIEPGVTQVDSWRATTDSTENLFGHAGVGVVR